MVLLNAPIAVSIAGAPAVGRGAEKQRSEGSFEHRISTSASKLARIRLIVRTAERARAV